MTLNLETFLVRPGDSRQRDPATHGQNVSMGHRVAVADADLVDEAGKLVARATATCLVLLP